jgi:hypothetical protein
VEVSPRRISTLRGAAGSCSTSLASIRRAIWKKLDSYWHLHEIARSGGVPCRLSLRPESFAIAARFEDISIGRTNDRAAGFGTMTAGLE